MSDYAKMDNALANSQLDIGESSNLAQLAQTYMCNFDDDKFNDYVCVLSVIAQAAIDNSKRRYDIDITKEIKRIKNDMDIKIHGYPSFWSIIKKDFNKKNINPDLHCPMNYLFDLDLNKFRDDSPTLPMSYFFVKYELSNNDVRRKCRKVEELLVKYSLNTYKSYEYEVPKENWVLLRKDFDDLINDIKKIKISKNYLGLFSWLIDRAFMVTPNIRSNNKQIITSLNKNKSLLLKVLYDINSSNLLKCFSKNC